MDNDDNKLNNAPIVEKLRKELKNKLISDLELKSNCMCGCHLHEGDPEERCVHCCGEYIIDTIINKHFK